MLVPLVRIRNSNGVRLPKAMIEQAGLTDQIDLEVQEGRIVLSASRRSRAGWQMGRRPAMKPATTLSEIGKPP